MKILTCLLLLLTSLFSSSAYKPKIYPLSHDSCLGTGLVEAQAAVDQPRDRGSRMGISCKDEMNMAVPWFIAYKIPKIQDSPIPLVREGRGYAYIDPNIFSENISWMLSTKGIDDQNSILGHTLRQRGTSLWFSYNDSTYSGGAHSKGIIMFHAQSQTAVWIVHSVPKLPIASPVNFYPPSGYSNGQTMMCINMPISTLVELVRGLVSIQPHMQDRHNLLNIEAALANQADRDMFTNLGATVPAQNDNENHVRTLRIVENNQHFNVYFKPPGKAIDLYSDYIAPNRGTHIQVQSWYKGRGGRMCHYTTNAQANIYNVYSCVQDVKTVRIKADNCQGERVDIQFSSGKDHSKWAVTEEIEIPWVCVSDLNRMVPQVNRGGSALCIRHRGVWTVFNQTIGSLQESSDGISSSTNNVRDELRY